MEFLKRILKFVLRENYYSRMQLFFFIQRHLAKYYNKKNERAVNEYQIIISMIDGRIDHGGLADRLRGIVSSYAWCKENNIIFKLNFNFPFTLQRYLLPNQIDWSIDESLISYNSIDSLPVFIDSRRQDRKNEVSLQKKLADYYLNKKYKQIHVYTNMYFADSSFSLLFNELFKPSILLDKNVEYHLKRIGGKYASVSFRFMKLLGDFDDSGKDTLDSIGRKKLILKCREIIYDLYEKHSSSGLSKIFVTSDSQTFIDEICNIDFVYVAPGTIGHIDKIADEDVNLKTFLDFYLIANADWVIMARNKRMYKSGFAYRASLVYNKPFEEYIFS